MFKKSLLLVIVLYSQNALAIAADFSAGEQSRTENTAIVRTLAFQKRWLSFNAPAAFCTFNDPITTGIGIMAYEGRIKDLLHKIPGSGAFKNRSIDALRGGLWHAFTYALCGASFTGQKQLINGWGIVLAHILTSLGMEYGYDLLRERAQETNTESTDSPDSYGLYSAKWAAKAAVAQLACYLIRLRCTTACPA